MKYKLKSFTRLFAVTCSICIIYLSCSSSKQNTVIHTVNADAFAAAFATPQDSLKPWVYYYWISDNISKEGITKDLEAMAKVGIGQTLIGNIGLDDVAPGKVPILSEEWWQLTEHVVREGKRLGINIAPANGFNAGQVVREGKRLGINIGMFNCPGWSQSGGPWVKTSEAMRYLVSSEITVDGGKKIIQKIPAAKDTFQDIKVIAFPAPKDDKVSIADVHPTTTSSVEAAVVTNLTDGDNNTVCSFPAVDGSINIDIATAQPFTARSLVIHPAQKSFSADIDLQIQQNGVYKTISSFLFNRTNPSVGVGPVPYSVVAVSFSEACSNKFRLVVSNVKDNENKKTNAAFAEIGLMASPKLERYPEKQLAKMFQTPLPLWNEFQWPNQKETTDTGFNIQASEVIDISKNLSADGQLNWDAPAGKWVVMRIGVTPTGTTNGPSAANARGLEVDKMNKNYLENHFNAYIGKVLERMPPEDRTAFNPDFAIEKNEAILSSLNKISTAKQLYFNNLND